MKKIYQKPIVNIVAVQLQQMIAESIAISNNGYDGATIQSRQGGGAWEDDDY